MGKKLKPAMASEKKIGSLITVVLLVVLYVFLFMLDNALPSNSTHHHADPRAEKGRHLRLGLRVYELAERVYGLFSLGQAGFMLIGAYAFAIFSIPV